jgi:hypothetical protein
MTILKLVKFPPQLRTGNIQNNVRSVKAWAKSTGISITGHTLRTSHDDEEFAYMQCRNGHCIVFGLKIFFPGKVLITVSTEEVDSGRKIHIYSTDPCSNLDWYTSYPDRVSRGFRKSLQANVRIVL